MRAHGSRYTIALLLAVLSAALLTPAAHAQLGDVVWVRSNYFDPFDLVVERGGTVTWTAADSGHTVTAADDRFDTGATLASGETFSWTFAGDEVVEYYCRIHGRPGRGMWGRIIVGDAEIPPPPPPEPAPPPRLVPSEYPTITAALDDAPWGTAIEVAPGLYTESLTLARDGVTIRGAGAAPDEVVIAAPKPSATIASVVADDVTIENLSLRGGAAGISARGVRALVVNRVFGEGASTVGIGLHGSASASIVESGVTGSATGVLIRGCASCDVLVDRVVAEANGIGLHARNAGGLAIVRSQLRGNGAGIVLTSSVSDAAVPQRGAHVWGNVVSDNNRTDLGAVSGIGIWIAGGWQDRIEQNTVAGHARYGIIATAWDTPAFDDAIVDNVVSGSGTSDLAWDGIGAGVCFDGNRTTDEAEPTSTPPAAQTLYPCDGLIRPGVPLPGLTLEMALGARP